jgi:hypothetical protein
VSQKGTIKIIWLWLVTIAIKNSVNKDGRTPLNKTNMENIIKTTRAFKLIGLNKPWKANGFNSIYATVDRGNEDWFHAAFDENLFQEDRLKALFDMFKNSEENLWHNKTHKVAIRMDGEKPIIKELTLDI